MNLDALIGVVIALVIVGMVSVIGLEVMEDSQDDLTANSAAYNASADAIEGIAKVPSKLPMIVTAIVGALIIGILLTYLYFKRR